jgi:hypothetical protein
LDYAPPRGPRAPAASRDGAAYRPRESGPRENGPRLPDTISAAQLDAEARTQLNSLPNDLADTVARYLVAAGTAEDPEQGYEYAQVARRLAARVGVVREATGIAAYQTGRWAETLAELRAARRLTGRDDYLPLMADSERALGRPDRALALIREADTSTLDRATQIELRIVESGIRRDQGLADAAGTRADQRAAASLVRPAVLRLRRSAARGRAYGRGQGRVRPRRGRRRRRRDRRGRPAGRARRRRVRGPSR